MEDYIVNKDGSIFSKKRNKYLKPWNNGCGYLVVDLCINGKRKTYQIHRLVAQKFIPNPNNLPQVNHKDGNTQNNHVDNLEWCNHINNCQTWNRLNTNFGSITIRESGNIYYRLVIYGKTYCKTFDEYADAEFYRLILKYCAYIKYR